MGCSNPHPHGQVWSLSAIPSLPAAELFNLKKYSLSEVKPSKAPKGPIGRPCMLCDYVHFELSVAEAEGRVVVKNNHWIALVPWWAIWPFEVMGACAQFISVQTPNMSTRSLTLPSTYSVHRASHVRGESDLCGYPWPCHSPI